MPDWTRHLLFAVAMAVLVVGGTVVLSQLLLPLADAPEVAASPVLSFVTLVFGA